MLSQPEQIVKYHCWQHQLPQWSHVPQMVAAMTGCNSCLWVFSCHLMDCYCHEMVVQTHLRCFRYNLASHPTDTDHIPCLKNRNKWFYVCLQHDGSHSEQVLHHVNHVNFGLHYTEYRTTYLKHYFWSSIKAHDKKRAFESEVLRKTFEPKEGEDTGWRRKLYNPEFHSFFAFHHIVVENLNQGRCNGQNM